MKIALIELDTKGWAIRGKFGIYSSWEHKKSSAIAAHVAHWRRPGESAVNVWRRLKRNGDCAVRINIRVAHV